MLELVNYTKKNAQNFPLLGRLFNEMGNKTESKKTKNNQMKVAIEINNQATPKVNEINGAKKKGKSDVSPTKLPLTPITVSTTSAVVDSATKSSPFISVIESLEQAKPTKDEEEKEPLPRLTSIDRLLKYPIVKNLYFLTRGIYISLVARYPSLSKPVLYSQNIFYKILGKYGIIILDNILDMWLNVAEPTMSLMWLPVIKFRECYLEMISIIMTPVAKKYCSHGHIHKSKSSTTTPTSTPTASTSPRSSASSGRNARLDFTEKIVCKVRNPIPVQYLRDGKLVEMTLKEVTTEEIGR
ncbi:uncharacterized protein LOC143918854 isoform X1 [Arctopsyche grandis]|uniref:uncharacterized protein LOC143918854 isoform X1 n=1 Tax=Arctopsyche grandis TaxID=121162 RepID=UPI00406D8CC3